MYSCSKNLDHTTSFIFIRWPLPRASRHLDCVTTNIENIFFTSYSYVYLIRDHCGCTHHLQDSNIVTTREGKQHNRLCLYATVQYVNTNCGYH